MRCFRPPACPTFAAPLLGHVAARSRPPLSRPRPRALGAARITVACSALRPLFSRRLTSAAL
eukprot:5402632-Alexandrium_andersonii.AAC.1